MAGFWLLRIVLQIVYYDREGRRENQWLDRMYLGVLGVLVVISRSGGVKAGGGRGALKTTLERHKQKQVPPFGRNDGENFRDNENLTYGKSLSDREYFTIG